jgi:predicted acyltransferase
MEKGSDVSKGLALVLIILTVLVSAVSTWVLITSSMESEIAPSNGFSLVHLNIFKSRAAEPTLMDANSGNARLVIAKGGN